ncbi:MAG: VWA domain-containing protein [Pedosphaera sp.]|nr:VWA domain-containing protein [Pedosphaera sp.]
MNFTSLQWLWLLALVPLLAALFFWNERRQQRLMELFIQSRLLGQLTTGVSPARRRFRLVLLLAAMASLAFAAARPRWGVVTEEARSEGLDIVVAIDTSRSMLAEDIRPNRLERAKLAAMELTQLARADRFALMPFAGSAFIQCPLTSDAEVLRQNINAIEAGIIPTGGSSLSEAIRTALTAFVDGDQSHKVLVLITDGEEHEPAALAAAEAAAKDGLRIFTVGVGSPEGELLRVPQNDGSVDYLRDENGRIVKSRLNEPLLRQIAVAARGFYLPLAGTKAIETLYRTGLAPLPKTKGESAQLRRLKEQYRWPLAFALLLLIAEIFFPERRREVSNDDMSRTTGKTALTAVLLVFAFISDTPVNASPAGALRDYESGRFDQAQKEFERLSEAHPAKPGKPDKQRLQQNAGAAAFQNGDFSAAARHFSEALKAPDLSLQQRAFYNLGNSFYRLGEHVSDPQQKIQMWEQSLRQFDGAIKLDKADTDAEFNRAFVHKKLEELKKKQPPPPPKKDDKKGSTQPKQEPKNGKGKQDEEESAGGQSSNDKKKKSPNQKSEEPQNGGDDRTDTADQPDEAPQMSPRQAQQLLDAQRDGEKALIHRPPGKARDRRVLKDW